MTYDSPKQIRRRQQRADAIRPKRRQADRTKVMTDEQWDRLCREHLACIHELASFPEAAARHASFLVTAAVQRRASVIMRDFNLCDLWTALRLARNEIYGEVA
jgi:hypothetical protein